ncbi:MAG TPA: PHP domain-containing protein [bacterium]|nr:PHP domain-containing protein [bacterium]
MTPLPIPDYHLHTAVTEDAESTLDEIAAAAVAAGLREIAVTNHFVVGLDTYRVTPEQLWEHRRRADELEDELGLSIKIGAEVDYFEDRLDEINEFLKSFDFDIVIGAAHFVEGLGVAAESSARELFGKYDALTVFKKSLLRIEAAAASGLFDVIAHLDIVRKFHRESDGEVRFSDYEEEAERIARALVESGTGFEVNCRGFQHATGS